MVNAGHTSQSTVKEHIGMRFEHIECRHYGGEGGPTDPPSSVHRVKQ